MKTYRLEVRADYARHAGQPDDIAAEVVAISAEHDVEVTGAAASRVARTDLVRVAVTFEADNDDTARAFRDALPSALRRGSAEADFLRTGIGRSFRTIR